MTDIFGLDIAGIARDAIEQAGGLLNATLTKVTPGDIDPNARTAGSQPTRKRYPCKGIVSGYTNRELLNQQIRVGDRKVMLLGATIPAGIIPEYNDQVDIDGEHLTIVQNGVDSDPAKATFTCQCRD